ncbi:MAG: hypothetical protein MI754_05160 [Chromatiales bacterium]|nr:hypothetical protein [Chromatiales bacterium]
MLFSVTALTEQGYPQHLPNREAISTVVGQTEQSLRGKYRDKRNQLLTDLERLKMIIHDPTAWWHSHPETVTARQQLQRFIDNIEYNFGEQSRGYQLLHSAHHREARLAAIIDNIRHYPAHRAAWSDVIGKSDLTTDEHFHS